MSKKGKIILIQISLIAIILIAGLTYSLYSSEVEVRSADQNIAQFIFKAEKTSAIELPLNNLLPGDNKEFTFSVTNNDLVEASEVAIEYQITLTTLHSIPLRYELRSTTEAETVIFTCDENTPRNANNILECKTPVIELSHTNLENNDYKLNVIFPSNYNDAIYANLVDYVDINIESWQKIN